MLGVFLCYDIDNPYISSRIVTGRRGGDDFYILDMPCRDLLQSLRTAEHARFAIYIDRETGTSTKTDFTASTRMEGVFSRISTADPPPASKFEEASITFLSNL